MSDPNNALSQVLAALGKFLLPLCALSLSQRQPFFPTNHLLFLSLLLLAANARSSNTTAPSNNPGDAAPVSSAPAPTTTAAPGPTPALNSLLPLLSPSMSQNPSNGLPAPDNTGQVGGPADGGVKPANTGLVSIADAIAKAREFAAEQGLAGAQGTFEKPESWWCQEAKNRYCVFVFV